MADLLIELFSEEIPARMQAKSREDLKTLITNGLVEAGLTYASAGAFSTPRRLVLSVEGLTAESKPVREERKGPRTDAPAAALEGFLRSTGLSKDQLEVRDDKKAQVYFAVIEKPGRAAPAIIAEVLEATIRNFPWPKSMRWGNGAYEVEWEGLVNKLMRSFKTTTSEAARTYYQKFFSDKPHSKPAFTSFTSSLKRLSESSSPVQTTTLLRSSRTDAPRLTSPSST